MKKIFTASVLVLLCAVFCVFAFADTEIKMTIGQNVGYVNGEAKELDAAPIIRGNRTMLPVRFVAENLGAKVEWDGTTSTATITKNHIEIEITIGAEEAIVNNAPVKLDAPAFIENNRTYMPVRFVAENLGAKVEWDGATSTATISLTDFVSFPDDYTVTYPNGFDYLSADLSQYITLGDYKDLSIECSFPDAVTDEDVATEIEIILEENPMINQITDRPAIIGDNVVIDFVGKLDGVIFEGGSATDMEVTLGSGMFIAGFEDGIVGMLVGETKAVEVVFPSEYHSPDLAGKPAVFDITLTSIYEEVPAEYTDAYVKDYFGCETKAEFEAMVRTSLEEEYKTELDEKKTAAAKDAAFSSATIIKFPDGLVEDYMYKQISEIRTFAEAYGITYEQFLILGGTTLEAFESELRAESEKGVTTVLVLYAIAKAENLIPTDKDVTDEIQNLFASAGVSVEEGCAILGFSYEELAASAFEYILQGNCENFLVANNTFTAK